MVSRNISPRQAYAILEAGMSDALLTILFLNTAPSALPLYNPTPVFYRHLELFAACNYHPTVDHAVVNAWVAEQSGGPPAKTQSIAKMTSISGSTNPTSLTITTSSPLSNCLPSRSIDAFDLASLSEALSRCQPTSPVAS